MRMMILATAFALCSYGCNVIGPSCLSQRHSGAVTTITAQVSAGAIVSHKVSYGTQGSQNNLEIRWTDQSSKDGPRIRVYATLLDCVDFTPRSANGICSDIGGFGGIISPNARPCAVAHTCSPEPDDLIQTSKIITNGHGNPETLGNPPEYKLWVVGDSQQTTNYTISITWFYGPDC